ncbi:MAG: peptidase T [Bacteroidia bacterium]|nr:peptidase T [Bacteroidia bacterium]
MTMSHTVTARFLRYVTLDTQSDPQSSSQPSTEKQKDLGRLLVDELQAIGVSDAHLDEFGYVYATLPATVAHAVPVICFCSHMDTSPDCSGAGVKPILHQAYDGRPLILPDDPSVVIRLEDHPHLAHQMGHDIITASGTTLLGADNKAGVAAIMDAAAWLMQHPEIPHGTIRILFTPDEEIGRGTAKVDLAKLGAVYGYTVDGEAVGSLEDETFSADGATLVIDGVSAHPGFAKGAMVSALKAAAAVVAALPAGELSPETTEGRAGFIHPVGISGTVEQAQVDFILRDFDDNLLQQHGDTLRALVDGVMADFPGAKATMTIREQYRNMKNILDQHPQVITHAEEAIRRAGLTPVRSSIRGGTDGSRLSFMGLPCANIFAGEHAFHSRQEWVSVQDMEKAAETLVHLAMVWGEA